MKFQFLTVSATTLLAVFMCAWPADYLMDVVRFDQLLYRLLQEKKKRIKRVSVLRVKIRCEWFTNRNGINDL